MEENQNLENNPMEENQVQKEPKEELKIPEGFNEDDFDEEGKLRLDSVKSKIDLLKKEIDEAKSQNLSMRQKLSGNRTPKTEEEFSQNFKVPASFVSNFEKDTEENKYIKTVFKDLDYVAHKSGLSINQANAVKTEVLNIFQDMGLITDKTEQEVLILKSQKRQKVLGEKEAEITKINIDFLDNFKVFSEAEANLLKENCTDGNPLFVSIVDKVRGLFGRSSSVSIPEQSERDGLPSDSKWLEQYKNAETLEEKLNLVKSREKAGREPKLKI